MNGVIKSAVQEPPRKENSGVLNKNTGFPEPLSRNSNTTLRHPSADTSPTACIESDDVPVSRVHTRHSSSFHLPHITSHNDASHAPAREQVKHPGMNISSNNPSIPNPNPNPNGNGNGNGIENAHGTTPLPNGTNAVLGTEMNGVNNAASVGATTTRTTAAAVSAAPLVHGGEDRDEQGYREGEMKKGLLRKIQLHRA